MVEKDHYAWRWTLLWSSSVLYLAPYKWMQPPYPTRNETNLSGPSLWVFMLQATVMAFFTSAIWKEKVPYPIKIRQLLSELFCYDFLHFCCMDEPTMSYQNELIFLALFVWLLHLCWMDEATISDESHTRWYPPSAMITSSTEDEDGPFQWGKLRSALARVRDRIQHLLAMER